MRKMKAESYSALNVNCDRKTYENSCYLGTRFNTESAKVAALAANRALSGSEDGLSARTQKKLSK